MESIFTDKHISIASPQDVPAINILLNNAYRGETSKKGWTTEANIIAGSTRTNEENVLQALKAPAAVFLKYTDEAGQICGCVNLQQKEQKLYLGMFAVNPEKQAGGIGKAILNAATVYAAAIYCTAIFMTVISVRTELIDWYKRHGYTETGGRTAFEEDALSGKHLQPLEFITLEKLL